MCILFSACRASVRLGVTGAAARRARSCSALPRGEVRGRGGARRPASEITFWLQNPATLPGALQQPHVSPHSTGPVAPARPLRGTHLRSPPPTPTRLRVPCPPLCPDSRAALGNGDTMGVGGWTWPLATSPWQWRGREAAR